MLVGGDLNVFPRPDGPLGPGDRRFPSDQLAPCTTAVGQSLVDRLATHFGRPLPVGAVEAGRFGAAGAVGLVAPALPFGDAADRHVADGAQLVVVADHHRLGRAPSDGTRATSAAVICTAAQSTSSSALRAGGVRTSPDASVRPVDRQAQGRRRSRHSLVIGHNGSQVDRKLSGREVNCVQRAQEGPRSE